MPAPFRDPGFDGETHLAGFAVAGEGRLGVRCCRVGLLLSVPFRGPRVGGDTPLAGFAWAKEGWLGMGCGGVGLVLFDERLLGACRSPYGARPAVRPGTACPPGLGSHCCRTIVSHICWFSQIWLNNKRSDPTSKHCFAQSPRSSLGLDGTQPHLQIIQNWKMHQNGDLPKRPPLPA